MHFKDSRTFIVTAAATAALLALGACSRPAEPAATAAADAPAVACNRQCLIDATDAYLAALAAHDISKARLSDQIVFVENAVKTKPGEGLWKSIVKGPSTFAIHAPTCGAATTLCEDDDCATLQEQLVTVVAPGTYLLAVHARQ